RPSRAPPQAFRGAGRLRPPTDQTGRGQARSLRPRFPRRRRAHGARRAERARRETIASAGPGRRKADVRSGRTSGRAARTAHERGACERWLPWPYSGRVTVAEDVASIADVAAGFAAPGEELAGVLVAEALGRRVYLCAFSSADGRAWLALRDDGQPLIDAQLVREAASLAALCEVAEE